METITLADTTRTTTRLGFGCSGLMGGISRRESLNLLLAAYDAGIRHFDVAPSYGYGEAERCLGQFLNGKSNVTVTTKYGIIPPKNQALISLARKIAIPIARSIPSLKSRFSRVAQSMQKEASFSADEARTSLERSLQQLQLDHVDIWLLHEATADRLGDDALLHYLQQSVSSGKIGTFGIGGEGTKMPDLYRQRRDYCRVLQFEWSITDPIIDLPGSFRIHHRALSDIYPVLRAKLLHHRTLCHRWSDAVGHDLAADSMLARLMLKTCLVMNPQSVILFSSRNPANIIQNVTVEEDASLEPGARRFYELYQREFGLLD